MSTLAPAKPLLTPAQVEAFHREGYLIYDRPVLPQDKFESLKAYFDKMLADLPADERPESMDVPHFLHPELFRWALDDAILDLVEPILGPDLALFSTHFICKPKGNGKRVPWHEDSNYWQSMLEPMEVVTVWLALDPSTRENGCMMVIPHTHRTGKRGFSDYTPVDSAKNVFGSEIIQEQRDDSRRVYIELQPNQASLHDGRIQHGSDPNTSNLRRCGWTIRFASAGVKFANHGEFDGKHQVYLARGQDRGGNKYADTSKAYPDLVARRLGSTRYKNSH
jgi:ectoine hydroxylase-related dioxygenase (phytanoyl-CoA dioxygenase family)